MSMVVTHADYPVRERNPARLGFVAIAVTFGGLGLWAATAPLDSATVASGQVAIESDRKPIQHFEGGIIQEILVKEAERVEAGQVLFRIDPVQAKSALAGLKAQWAASVAEAARLQAERDEAQEIVAPPEIAERVGPTIAADVIAAERRQFSEHRRSIETDVRLQEARIAQAERDIASRSSQVVSLKHQLESFDAELKAVGDLAKKGFYPRNKLLGLQRDRLRVDSELKGAEADVARAGGTVDEARLAIRQIRQKAAEDAGKQWTVTRGRIADMEEKLVVAGDVLSRTEVKAPRAGIIQGIKVHTIGAVVRSGDVLADLVTLTDGLIFTARVLPADIHNVAVGQRTEVRLPSLGREQRRPAYGSVESLSADLLIDDATRQGYYAARVVLDPATLDAELARKLVQGMPADVIIINGERTALSYLFEPVLNRLAKGLRER